MCMAFIGLVVVHLGCNIVFDGLVRLSDSFGLDFFLTFCLNSVTELPANFILAVVLDRYAKHFNSRFPFHINASIVMD